MRKWVVYLLPHSHVDIGYTHVQTDVEQAQWKYLEMAIDAARKSRRLIRPARGSSGTSRCSGRWTATCKQATPEKRQAFFDAVKAGQVGLQALYGNELTGLCRPEELLRLLGCAQRALAAVRRARSTSAMITDVPGYTWGIVPAFAHSGVKYFCIGPNGGDRIGHTIAAWGDKPFWWIGPNGKDKVLVWMTGTGYYQVFQLGRTTSWTTSRSLEAKGYPYDFVQVRHCLGDNGAPDVNFADTVKAVERDARLSEARHRHDRRDVPRLRAALRRQDSRRRKGDFTPYWEDGAASSARETALNRASADRLTQAETLFAHVQPEGLSRPRTSTRPGATSSSTTNTPGARTTASASPTHPFVKSQWAIKQASSRWTPTRSRASCSPRRTPAAARRRRCPPAEVQAHRRRQHHRRQPIPTALVVGAEGTVHGRRRASRLVADERSRLVVPTADHRRTGVPPVLGRLLAPAASTSPATSPRADAKFRGASAEGTTLTTADSAVARGLTLRLDEKTGAIASLRLSTATNWWTPTRPPALNDYFYLPGSDLKGLQRNGPVKISVKERGPLIASLLVESDAPGCRKLTREIRAPRAAQLRRDHQHGGQGCRCAPRKASTSASASTCPTAWCGWTCPGAWCGRKLDQIPGACKNWFTVQRWVDISNDGLRRHLADARRAAGRGRRHHRQPDRLAVRPARLAGQHRAVADDLLLGHEQSLAHELPRRAGGPHRVPLLHLAARRVLRRRRDPARPGVQPAARRPAGARRTAQSTRALLQPQRDDYRAQAQ